MDVAIAVFSGILMAALACFSFVLLFGAPYLPTLRPQAMAALDLLDLKTGELMLELGCGDGRVLVAAAERGWRAVGYELNPILVLVARRRTRRYGEKVKVIWGDYWRAEWPTAEGIYGFILPRFMRKLHTKITHAKSRPIRLASFAFAIPGQHPAATKQGVFLYVYD